MIKAALLFSRIHLYRYLRMLNQLGIFRVVFLAIILFFALKYTLRPGMLYWQAIAVLSIVVQAHTGRKDFVLLNNLGLNHPGFFILLYLILLCPFIILYLLRIDYIALAILLTGIGLISLIRKPIRLTRKKYYPSFRIIPADAWEWRAGLRTNYLLILAILLLVLLFHRYEFIPASAVLALSIITASFQMIHEPRNMLTSLGRSPASLFRRKVLLQTALFTTMALPLVISSYLLFPDSIRPVMLVFISSLLVQAFAVAIKYSGFQPGEKTPYNMILVTLLNFTFILPVLLPLPVIMLAVFTKKAIFQLKQITDDQH